MIPQGPLIPVSPLCGPKFLKSSGLIFPRQLKSPDAVYGTKAIRDAGCITRLPPRPAFRGWAFQAKESMRVERIVVNQGGHHVMCIKFMHVFVLHLDSSMFLMLALLTLPSLLSDHQLHLNHHSQHQHIHHHYHHESTPTSPLNV